MRGEARADWIEREQLPENRIQIDVTAANANPLVRATGEQLKRDKKEGWITPSFGCLDVRVSRAQLPRALAIADALLSACETRDWKGVAEFPMPRQRSTLGTFWHPRAGWTYEMPKERRAEIGVII